MSFLMGRWQPPPHNPDTPPDTADPGGPCPRCGRVSSFEIIATAPVTFFSGIYVAVGRGTDDERVANVKLAEAGIAPIGHLTFHSLRRTYASLRCACGDDVRYTAAQLGHEDPRFTLRVYAQATARRDRMAKPQREAFDRALEWATVNGDVLDAALDIHNASVPG
jgi:hypothetical protein